jgi:peptidyl-prolyl cis-trans isomerase C
MNTKKIKGLLLILAFGLFFVFYQAQASSVLATVGNKKITDEDIRAEFLNLSDEQKKSVNSDPSILRNLVENAVNSELLVQAGEKSGIEKTEDFKKALERFKRQYLATKVMEQVIEKKLTKEAIKKFYEENKRLFDNTQVCASHIVVSTESEAKSIVEKINKGAKFAELAKSKSLDPTVQDNEGDLGCFTRDRMVPEFTNAAFSMKVGEVKGPVKTMYGYHVIKVNKIIPGKVPGFTEVEQRAKDALRLKLLQEYVAELRKGTKISIDENSLKNFKL